MLNVWGLTCVLVITIGGGSDLAYQYSLMGAFQPDRYAQLTFPFDWRRD